MHVHQVHVVAVALLESWGNHYEVIGCVFQGKQHCLRQGDVVAARMGLLASLAHFQQ